MNLVDLKQYVQPYLEFLIVSGYAASTVRSYASALAKLFQCASTDFGVKYPPNKRGDSFKNREANPKFDLRKPYNCNFHALCESTGLREECLKHLNPDQVWQKDGKTWVRVLSGKGGRGRRVECLDNFPYQLAQQAKAAGRNRVFTHISRYSKSHHSRRNYAMNMYQRYKMPLQELSKKEKYYARAELKGCVFDRNALAKVSKNLGHCRPNVVLTYLQIDDENRHFFMESNQ